MVMPFELELQEEPRYTNTQVGQLVNTIELFQERIAELEFAEEDWGWTKLGDTEQNEFSRGHLRRIIARSRLFFLQNPLINRAVTLQADYVFAQGLNIQGTNDDVNAVIQEFVEDVQNQSEFTSHSARLLNEQTLLLDGNLFFVLFTDKKNTGQVRIRSIAVDEITEIITNPEDSAEVWFYKREWISVDQNGQKTKQNTAYYPDIDYMPITSGSGKLPQTKAKNTIYWDAPVLHMKTGSLKKSKFGTPETYSALDWAKAHSKMLSDWATIIAAYARFAFKFTVPGNKSSLVGARNKLETTIGTGSLRETNPSSITASTFIRQKDGVDIEPIKTAGATTSAKDARELRIMVAAAMGLPDPMLSGEVDVGNLATAKTLDRPTELKFRSRQKIWEGTTLRILKWVLRWAIEAPNGLLKSNFKVTYDKRGQKIYVPQNDPTTGKPFDQHVEVVFPPILERTIQERIDAITGAVTLNGKTFAIDSPELKKLTIRLMLQALGLTDVDEHVDTIFAGLSDADLKDNPNDQTGATDTPDPNNPKTQQQPPTEVQARS